MFTVHFCFVVTVLFAVPCIKPSIAGAEECFTAKGSVVCKCEGNDTTRTALIESGTAYMMDIDEPDNEDDFMGAGCIDKGTGGFDFEGCGSDNGWFNTPDPQVFVRVRCKCGNDVWNGFQSTGQYESSTYPQDGGVGTIVVVAQNPRYSKCNRWPFSLLSEGCKKMVAKLTER